MSSFVVGKEIYIRAAGLIAGIQDYMKPAYRREYLIYDYTAKKWMKPEDFLKKFEHFYNLNVLSVNEQYHAKSFSDGDMEGTPPTEAECKKVFNEYRKKGKSLMLNGKGKDLIMSLKNFFDCCKYQTEKEPYYFEMMMFFDRLLVALMPILHPENRDGWTDLEF